MLERKIFHNCIRTYKSDLLPARFVKSFAAGLFPNCGVALTRSASGEVQQICGGQRPAGEGRSITRSDLLTCDSICT
jgi:hypothetical protein